MFVAGHDHRYAIDASKLENELGLRAAGTFESGLAEPVPGSVVFGESRVVAGHSPSRLQGGADWTAGLMFAAYGYSSLRRSLKNQSLRDALRQNPERRKRQWSDSSS